jgi:hypothetical protein
MIYIKARAQKKKVLPDKGEIIICDENLILTCYFFFSNKFCIKEQKRNE